MSLSHEQRYLLEELREYLQRVEKVVPRYDLDLDAFATEYAATGYKLKHNEMPERAAQRRKVFFSANSSVTMQQDD